MMKHWAPEQPAGVAISLTQFRRVEPLAASAWSAGFGMLTDRFGVTWSVSVAAE